MIVDEADARASLARLPQCDSLAMERLELLVSLLREENARQNLVSSSSLKAVWTRHVADSAQLLRFVPRETTGEWLDLGTGAGFPGLVIAALVPDMVVHLVESRGRRAEWLETARVALGLESAQVHGVRLETLSSFDAAVISARAFAPLHKLLDLSIRFSTTATTWLLPKGASAQHELAELCGWNHMFHVEPSLTDAEAGIIVGSLAGGKVQTT